MRFYTRNIGSGSYTKNSYCKASKQLCSCEHTHVYTLICTYTHIHSFCISTDISINLQLWKEACIEIDYPDIALSDVDPVSPKKELLKTACCHFQRPASATCGDFSTQSPSLEGRRGPLTPTPPPQSTYRIFLEPHMGLTNWLLLWLVFRGVWQGLGALLQDHIDSRR